MGTRLTINKLKKNYFYATKLYGYIDGWQNLPSFQYLSQMYLPNEMDEITEPEQIPPVLMMVCDFRKWIIMYNEELKYSPYNKDDNLLKNKFIKNIMKMEDYEHILLTWG